MRRDKTTGLLWAALWLLCTLASLLHVSLAAPVQVEQPSDPTEQPTNTSHAVLKQIEQAFRKGSTVKNILKTLETVGGEVDLRELSKAVVAHVLSATENGQKATASSGDDQLPTSPMTEGASLPTPSDEAAETDVTRSEDEEVLVDSEVTPAPQTARTHRQTTLMTTGSPQGGATLPIIPTSAAGVRIAEATAATKRWLDASKKTASFSSTPTPEKEGEDDEVEDATILPNASFTSAVGDEGMVTEKMTLDEDNQFKMPSNPGWEDDNMTTKAPAESKGDDKPESEDFPKANFSDWGASEPMPDSYLGTAAIQPVLSPEDSGNQQQSDEDAAVTSFPTTEPSKDTQTETTKTDLLPEEEIPYGQDEADQLTAQPFDLQAEKTTMTTAAMASENSDEGNEPVTTAASFYPSTTREPNEEAPSKGPEENDTKSNQSEDDMINDSTEKSGEKVLTQESDGTEDEEGNQQRDNASDDTAEPAASPSLPLPDTPPVDVERTTAAAPPAETLNTEPDSSFMKAGNPAAAVSPSANRSSTFVPSTDPEPNLASTTSTGSSLTSDTKPSPIPVPTSNSAFKQSLPTHGSADVTADPQATLESITRFQAPLRLLLINKLGTEFARLTKVFRRPNLTDPLPDISAIVSEALSSVRADHLRPPAKRDAAEERDALELRVNGVRVDVNVTRQPDFVQNGPTTVNHLDIDRRRMYVRLHLHFRNVSVPLNFSVAADLFPPFFSVRRASGAAHVHIGEVLVPLRIPFKLYFQKRDDEAAAAGVLMPEDFVTHGASMLDVSTRFVDCGERDFMEKEVLRFEEHLKNQLELWLSRDPLTSLTDTLRDHLLVASRQPATMGLARGVSGDTPITDAITLRSVSTSTVPPDAGGVSPQTDSPPSDEAEDEMDMFGFGD